MRDAERSELADELIDGRGEGVSIRHVGRPGCCAPTRRPHLTGQRVQSVVVKADRRDVGTFARGSQGGLASDAALRTRNKHNVTGEPGKLVSHSPP